MAGEARLSGFLSGFDSWTHLFRFIVAIGAAAILVLLALISLRWLPVEVTVNTEGAMTVRGLPLVRDQLVTYELAAAHLWADTGIEVKSGSHLHITASGLINLGLGEIAKSAGDRTRAQSQWASPDGYPFVANTCPDRRRRALLLSTTSNMGCLLARVVAAGSPGPVPGHFHSPDVAPIGRSGDIVYQDEKGRNGRLYLVVNDMVLEDLPESKAAYVTDLACLGEPSNKARNEKRSPADQLRKRMSNWDNFMQEEYWRVYFDDNVGSFLIQIRIT